MREEVKKGYEEGDYDSDYRDGREIQEIEKKFFSQVFEKLPEDSEFLDLGCGTGLPFDRYIAENGFAVTGIDIADKHVEQARENLPRQQFLQGDFFDLDFEENSFDAVVSFYAIFHIPREEHLELLEKIRYWVREEGLILITLGPGEMDEHRGEIGGEDMIWSSYSQEKNLGIVEEAGFDIIESYVEDWREESHLWVLAEPE